MPKNLRRAYGNLDKKKAKGIRRLNLNFDHIMVKSVAGATRRRHANACEGFTGRINLDKSTTCKTERVENRARQDQKGEIRWAGINEQTDPSIPRKRSEDSRSVINECNVLLMIFHARSRVISTSFHLSIYLSRYIKSQITSFRGKTILLS